MFAIATRSSIEPRSGTPTAAGAGLRLPLGELAADYDDEDPFDEMDEEDDEEDDDEEVDEQGEDDPYDDEDESAGDDDFDDDFIFE